MNSTLAMRFKNQEARGFKDGYATNAQFSGITLFVKDIYILSSSSDIKTSPLIALCSSWSDDFIFSSTTLYRSISCDKTVDSESICSPRTTNVLSPASSFDSMDGTLDSISCASSFTTSSPDLPPPAFRLRGCKLKQVSKTALVSLDCNDMSAFACIPNTSGASVNGKVSI